MDYILFIHGVNTRGRREAPTYADELRSRILEKYKQNTYDQRVPPKMISLYWGNVCEEPENELLRAYQSSPAWKGLSLKRLRSRQLLQFSGDAALYISRYVGARVVETLLKEVLDPACGLGAYTSEDHLHLVTHSWGTVIFFDVLFSGRWDPKQAGSYEGVQKIREAIFGLEPRPDKGLHLVSIHTMGSPISVFSLMMGTERSRFSAIPPGIADGRNIPSTHDITPGLLEWLRNLRYPPLLWYNYLHPEDPIAYPLERLIPQMLKERPLDFVLEDKLMVQDVPTASPTRFVNALTALPGSGPGIGDLVQAAQLIFHGGQAHHSYWTSEKVVNGVFQSIQGTMSRLNP